MKILPVYYFPPVAWFAAVAQEKSVLLEQWSHYRKQNFHNRATIRTASQLLHLSIPVCKAKEHTPLNAREISYDWAWQRDQWRSLESAYRRSPYFEYYEEDLRPFFETEYRSLLQLNLEILDTLKRMLQLDTEWTLSSAYEEPEFYSEDLRLAFPTKSGELPAKFKPQPYLQVFGEDFVPNLSILDLLFNKGPESLGILKNGWGD